MDESELIISRFMTKVPERPTDGSCWQWGAGKFSSGYGAFYALHSSGRYQNRPAHLISYELFVGPVPEGMEIDHWCHTEDESCPGGRDCPHRGCVNPDHLEPVTRLENLRRGRAKNMISSQTGRCESGRHDMSDIYESRGRKQCRPCQLEKGQEYRSKK